MPKSDMSVSIVVPAYNEARYLRDCLLSIEQQTVRPLEVIVVDNNSTDGTAAIAREFSCVRVVHEVAQGISPARSRGFDEARGDIIGRIDADSRLAKNWVEKVVCEFARDDVLVALGGPAGISEFSPHGRVWWAWASYVFQHMQRRSLRVVEPLLYGNNMALRREAWQQVRELAQTDDRYHEDIDLGFILSRVGRIKFSYALQVGVSLRRMLDIKKICKYHQKDKATREKHFGKK